MVASVRASGGRLVYRPLFARVLIVVFAAFGLWWDADLLIRGSTGAAVLMLLWLVAACTGLAALFWRPAVIVDDEGTELRNVLRDVQVPWAALDAVETRFALTLVVGRRRYSSWAGASGGRPPRRRPSDVTLPADVRESPESGPASRHPATGSGATAVLVEQRWRAWQAAARPGDQAGHQGDPGERAGDRPPVVVRWRPQLVAASVGAAGLAAVLTPALH